MFNTDTLWFEVAIVSLIFAFGHIFFGHFEEQTPKWRKVLKLVMFLVIVSGISSYFGREWTFVFLGVLFLLVLYIHGVWLPSKGINGLTGEPRDTYYKLRGWKKKKEAK